MNSSQIEALYSSLINDTSFDRLDLQLRTPNIFSILKIGRQEIRHSNFLAWLLQPNEGHGLEDLFLKRFLREVFASDRFEHISQVDVESMDLSRTVILREWNNIDILIVTPQVVVCVENKVFSKEHSNQLVRYQNIIEESYPNLKQTFVYLNPEGDEPEEETANYYPISYSFIVDTLERIFEVYSDQLNPKTLNYMKDYITTIKRDILGMDKEIELARKIYLNHKELFDFIIENKPDETQKIHDLLSEVVQDYGYNIGSESKIYIRFLSLEVEPLIYINKQIKNGWSKSESFLHEIRINLKRGLLIYKPVISPCDPSYNSDKLLELLMEIDGFRQPWGKKWRVPYQKNYKFNFDALEGLSDDEIKLKFAEFFNKILPQVKKVDEKLMEHRDLLLDLKNIS